MERDPYIYEGKTALIIDDETLMKRLITALLNDMGFAHVVTAEDGAEGLKVLESNASIDVVICDLEMPLIGGLEFLSMLRTSQSVFDRNIPVLVVTGHSEERNLHQAVELGIHGFLVKPISHTALEKRVYHALTQDQIPQKQLTTGHKSASPTTRPPEFMDFNKE